MSKKLNAEGELSQEATTGNETTASRGAEILTPPTHGKERITVFDGNMGSVRRVPFDSSMEPKVVSPNTGEVIERGYPVFNEFVATYPPVVVEALRSLYEEYRQAFMPLIKANMEWQTDYRFCFDANKVPIIYGVQIDMQMLTTQVIDSWVKAGLSADEIKEILRPNIFEIEGSLAMTPMLEVLFQEGEEPSQFRQATRGMLDSIREIHQRPVIILAVTETKRNAILASEFGVLEGEAKPSTKEILTRSGFNDVWGPEEFKAEVARLKSQWAQNTDGCQSQFFSEKDYLMALLPICYVRASDPVAKLKNPSLQVQTMLDNAELREFVKAQAITFNIDNPARPEVGINDTKAYMERMGLAYPITSIEDLVSPDMILMDYLKDIKTQLTDLSKRYKSFATRDVQNSDQYKQIETKKDRLTGIIQNPKYNTNTSVQRKTRLENLKKVGFAKYGIDQSTVVREYGQGKYAKVLNGIAEAIQLVDYITNIITKGQSIDDLYYKKYEWLKTLLFALDIDLPESLDFNNLTGSLINAKFEAYLRANGVDPKEVLSGKAKLRFKPLANSYGCYGHLPKAGLDSLPKLQKHMQQRGSYVVQIERPQLICRDSNNGKEFVVIHRNFFMPKIQRNPDTGEIIVEMVPAGGFANMIPAEDQEGKEGRVHGNEDMSVGQVNMQVT